jgi:hypothetical protein
MIALSLIFAAPASAFARVLNQGDIVFRPGTSSATLTGAIVRGDSDQYSLVASAGQWMEVKISSPEDNAVFSLSIYSYGTGEEVQLEGAKEGQDAKHWQGTLPSPGYSKDGTQNSLMLTVGATRGNASYRLSVKILNQPGQAVPAAAVTTAEGPADTLAMGRESVNGKYRKLIQTLNCPQDRGQYGEFADYGYWQGGPWCQQVGKAGYWVWVPPNWYVWAETATPSGKAASGTLTSLTMGDRACYVEFVDATGLNHQELAAFDLCDQTQLLHRHVTFSYQQEKVMSSACGGDPECTRSDLVWLISAMQ